MPYIVITKRPHSKHPEVFPMRIDSRRAVSTLDEARHDVEDSLREHYADGEAASRSVILAARGLPASGGTVGPLPDGTVIEVSHVDEDVQLESARRDQRGLGDGCGR